MKTIYDGTVSDERVKTETTKTLDSLGVTYNVSYNRITAIYSNADPGKARRLREIFEGLECYNITTFDC